MKPQTAPGEEVPESNRPAAAAGIFSPNPPNSTPVSRISREAHAALFAVINKARMLNGWAPKSARELDPTIRVWHEILALYRIPAEAFDALYKRAIETRAAFLAGGKEPPLFGAELLAACWTGPHGLKAELEQRRIESGKFLTENAASVCRHCHGSNWRPVKERGYMGVVRCQHED